MNSSSLALFGTLTLAQLLFAASLPVHASMVGIEALLAPAGKSTVFDLIPSLESPSQQPAEHSRHAIFNKFMLPCPNGASRANTYSCAYEAVNASPLRPYNSPKNAPLWSYLPLFGQHSGSVLYGDMHLIGLADIQSLLQGLKVRSSDPRGRGESNIRSR